MGVLDEMESSVLDEIIRSEPFIFATLPQIPPIPPIPPTPGPVVCFLKGTKILTDNGEKYIENLVKGTYLINHEGKKIKLLDVYTFKKYKNTDTHPCLIKKGTIIDNNECNKDLYLSQDHCVLVKNYFVPIKKIVKPMKLKDNLDFYNYYHLVTENYFTDVVIANGIMTETYGKVISKCLNKDIYNYLKNYLIHNGNRTLLNKVDFNNLINKFSTIQKMKKITSLQHLQIKDERRAYLFSRRHS